MCVYVCVFVCVSVCACVRARACVCVCVCVCACVCVCLFPGVVVGWLSNLPAVCMWCPGDNYTFRHVRGWLRLSSFHHPSLHVGMMMVPQVSSAVEMIILLSWHCRAASRLTIRHMPSLCDLAPIWGRGGRESDFTTTQSLAVDLLSATVVLLHLTQIAVPFVQIVTTVFLQGTWFYTIFL